MSNRGSRRPSSLDKPRTLPVVTAAKLARRTGAFLFAPARDASPTARDGPMKIKNSLKSLKARDRNNRVVRRKGRVYVINKQNPRYKARQG